MSVKWLHEQDALFLFLFGCIFSTVLFREIMSIHIPVPGLLQTLSPTLIPVLVAF